jgi:hypothetical protein
MWSAVLEESAQNCQDFFVNIFLIFVVLLRKYGFRAG